MQAIYAEKRRLVFLTVNCSYSHSSLALPLLHSACLDLTQWEWFRCDMTTSNDPVAAVAEISTYKCDLLVADLYLFNRQTVLEVLQRYHTIDPACRIAVGGPECLGEGAEELLKEYPWLDRVFRGEGEMIFRDYLENFDAPSQPPGRIVPENGNAVYEQWSSSPYPVTDHFFVCDKPFVQIETSRGCPMGCFYCTSGGTRTRYRSLEQVREELQLLCFKGIKEIRVLDRTFNLPQERGAALLRMFREEFPQMRFHLELHPQFLNSVLREELLKALPGQLHIEVGIQCLDPHVQNLSGRRSDVVAALAGLEFLCGQAQLVTHADLLAALPGQCWQHILADTAALMKINTQEIQLEVLKALPGTPLREIAEKHGMRYNPSTPYDVMMSNTMTLEEVQKSRVLSRLLDLTYNNSYLHEAVLTMSCESTEFVPRFLEFFQRIGGNCRTVWDLKKRFLFLLDFCSEYNLPKSRAVLAFKWLQAGYLPGQGPDKYTRKADKIPPAAKLCSGVPECVGERESQYWALPVNGKNYYLVYNRKYALNRPAAIFSL